MYTPQNPSVIKALEIIKEGLKNNNLSLFYNTQFTFSFEDHLFFETAVAKSEGNNLSREIYKVFKNECDIIIKYESLCDGILIAIIGGNGVKNKDKFIRKAETAANHFNFSYRVIDRFMYTGVSLSVEGIKDKLPETVNNMLFSLSFIISGKKNW